MGEWVLVGEKKDTFSLKKKICLCDFYIHLPPLLKKIRSIFNGKMRQFALIKSCLSSK